jgi:DNA-binding PadR family transcriptional regulator
VSVRSSLLQLLDEGERHGYQLKVDFEARTGGIWPLNVGQVYTTLERLVRDGLVTETGDDDGDGGQRTYRITEDGRHEVKQWLASSPTDTAPPRDELLMKVLLAVGRGGPEAVAVIDDQRSALLVALQMGRRQQRARTEDDDLPARLAHDALLSRLEADVTWLDRCEEQLRANDPTPRSTTR